MHCGDPRAASARARRNETTRNDTDADARGDERNERRQI
jgi:hypothetical protein